MGNFINNAPFALVIVFLIIGFVLLIKGADFFVEGSSSVAKRLHVPSIIIGLTIVAMGTSLPETAVSVSASITGNNELAVSNVVGSNIFNLMVVIGVCAMIATVNVAKETIKRDIPFSLICAGLLLILGILGVGDKSGMMLGHFDGVIFIGADSHTCTYGALGAFSTGVGSTDMAAGMATGKAWFKVPSAIKFNLTGKLNKWVSGKDVILHIIGMIGVDGALYKSMEFTGPGVSTLTMDDRFTIANMAIEAGGKNGIFPVDDLAREYMKEHSKRPFVEYTADDDAEYDKVYDIDLSTIRSTVA